MPPSLRSSAASALASAAQQPCPRFAFVELTCRRARPWLDYLTCLGFMQANSYQLGAAVAYDMQRGSFRILVTEVASHHRGYARVMRRGDHVSEIGFAYTDVGELDRVFAVAETSGLRSAQRWGNTLGGASYYRTLEGPGDIRYSLWDASAGFGDTNQDTAPGTLDHVAFAVPSADVAAVIRLHERLGLIWTPVDRKELPGGEAMDSGYFISGSLRITLVFPAGACRQLDDIIAGNDGMTVLQHCALDVADLPGEVATSRASGLRWLDAPPGSYYEPGRLRDRIGHDMPEAEIRALQDTGVLVSATGLRQIFTAPPVPGSGFFLEGIQRRTPDGDFAEGFGDDNILELARVKQAAGQEAIPGTRR